MKLGEIYYWETDKAVGYVSRFKYHIFVCESVFPYENIFLFVNKENAFSDYPIYKKDYSFFPLDVSFVSSNKLVSYSDGELAASQPILKGKLSLTHLQELHDWMMDSESMAQRDINIICNAIRKS